MATADTIENFNIIKFADEHPDLIPIATDTGYGNHYAPSKKKKYFVAGEVRIPAECFKPELQECLTTIRKCIIKTFVFVPKDMASEKLLELLKDKDDEKTT